MLPALIMCVFFLLNVASDCLYFLGDDLMTAGQTQTMSEGTGCTAGHKERKEVSDEITHHD